ncbi:hypothetical protein [Streptosporangium sp. NBC_01756]|nr:hypothetical protein [Streptosporangium sp. NBC_01756]WSC83351.1 hypothetical protein OIE48_23385 [Streptosporangium sp. NBC_01756]
METSSRSSSRSVATFESVLAWQVPVVEIPSRSVGSAMKSGPR